MERVLGSSDKLIYDAGKSGQGVLPYLPLSELTTHRPPAMGQSPQSGGAR
jgi:modulator of FtsH protease HflK